MTFKTLFFHKLFHLPKPSSVLVSSCQEKQKSSILAKSISIPKNIEVTPFIKMGILSDNN